MEVEVGVDFFCKFAYNLQKEQIKYKVERFNPNVHILFQKKIIKMEKKMKTNNVSQKRLLNV